MRFLEGVLLVLGLMIAVMAVWWLGPLVETKYFPVYSKFKILEMSSTETGVAFRARFTKFRNCDPQGYAWYVGDFGVGATTIPVRGLSSGGTVHRPLGTHVIGPVNLQNITIDDVPNLYAETYHRCHPLWITRTVIYP